MEMGMGRLEIPPAQFWKLTLREFWAIYYGRFGRKKAVEPMSLSRLKELKEKFPDDPRRASRKNSS